MLTHAMPAAASLFAELRTREFARLDAAGVAYLDYAGSALYADSHVAAHRTLLARSVLGNPHSANAASLSSTRLIDAARARVRRFFDAGDDYDVIFSANASAAIKLVAEAYPFDRDTACVLTADNHNSVNGIREYARRAGARVSYLPLGRDLRLRHPDARLARAGGPGLFAFPAQSNFSGIQHPLALAAEARARGFHVLLDAAAFVPSHALSLRACPADFVAVSFYKMFGYPTGLGALVARHEALEILRRPWFAGGTVDYASVQLERHQLRERHGAFEDGTSDFLGISALDYGFDLLDRVGLAAIASHTGALARALAVGLSSLAHADGTPVVRLYGAADGAQPAAAHGATVTFNVLDRAGRTVPFDAVERRANDAGVHLRGGCFCNPGASEAAFGLEGPRMARCLDALGGGFSVPALQRCTGPDVAIGAVRASIGMANNRADIERAIAVIGSFAGSAPPANSQLRNAAIPK